MKILLTCGLLGGFLASAAVAHAVEIPGSEAGRRASDDAARRSVASGLQNAPLTGAGPTTMLGYTAAPRSVARPASNVVPGKRSGRTRSDRQTPDASPLSGAFPF